MGQIIKLTYLLTNYWTGYGGGVEVRTAGVSSVVIVTRLTDTDAITTDGVDITAHITR